MDRRRGGLLLGVFRGRAGQVERARARRCARRRRRRCAAVARGRAERAPGRGPATRPGWGERTTISSASRTASAMLCVTTTMVVPVRCQSPSSSIVEALAGQRVEGAERLVEEQHRWVAGERARDRRALAHATRQLVRVGALERAPAPTRSSSSARARAVRPADAGELERKGDVVDRPCARAAGAAPGTRARRARRRRRPVPRRSGSRRASGRSSPAISRSSVLLPEPFGPEDRS